jgi:hypothetical protein
MGDKWRQTRLGWIEGRIEQLIGKIKKDYCRHGHRDVRTHVRTGGDHGNGGVLDGGGSVAVLGLVGLVGDVSGRHLG